MPAPIKDHSDYAWPSFIRQAQNCNILIGKLQSSLVTWNRQNQHLHLHPTSLDKITINYGTTACCSLLHRHHHPFKCIPPFSSSVLRKWSCRVFVLGLSMRCVNSIVFLTLLLFHFTYFVCNVLSVLCFGRYTTMSARRRRRKECLKSAMNGKIVVLLCIFTAVESESWKHGLCSWKNRMGKNQCCQILRGESTQVRIVQ